MFKAQIWDGTTQQFTDQQAAIDWAMIQLQDWMQKGDRIAQWSSEESQQEVNYLIVIDAVGQDTDASAHVYRSSDYQMESKSVLI